MVVISPIKDLHGNSKLYANSLFLALTLTAITAFAMITAFFVVQATVVQNLELQYAREYQQLYSGFLSRQAQELLGTTADWAFWNDTYYFAQGTHPDYIDENLESESMQHLDIDHLLISDRTGQVLFEDSFCDDCAEGVGLTSLPGWEALRREILAEVKGKSTVFSTEKGLLLIGAQPILTSLGQGDPAGVLVFGRFVEPTILGRLNTPEKVRIRISVKDAPYPDGFFWDRDHVLTQVALHGPGGSVVGHIELTVPRFIAQTLRRTAVWVLVCIGGLLITMIFAVLQAARKQILDPLAHLTEQMKVIGMKGEGTNRVTVPENLGEISTLALECNRTLEQLERSQRSTAKRAAYLRYITENVHDIIVELDHEFVIRWAASSIRAELGYDSDQVVGKPVPPFIHPEDRHEAYHWLTTLRSAGKTGPLEMRVRSHNDEYIWMEMTGQAMDAGIVISARNVEQRKRDQDRIAFLSFFDDTTGLYNRSYLEKQLQVLEAQKVIPTSVLMVDVNGLKLANDTFGHEEGDNLLRRIAQLLQKAVGPNAILGRWGGDEFVILMPGTNREERDEIRQKILELCEAATADPIRPSVSVGDATREQMEQNLRQVIRTAEERMYRHKLTESRSARSAIIAALQASLSEKTMETQEHAQRMQYLAELLGRRIGMSGSELEELSLAVMLHDIGKVAIPMHILEKPGRLNEREWEIMQSHTEVGYRIAAASLELAFIADAILYHHERWDGTGYPEQHRGEDIPLISRVIALVDAYDVMTHERPYAVARRHEEAIAELKRCRGSQFDPELTDLFLEILADWNGLVPERPPARPRLLSDRIQTENRNRRK